MTINQEIQKLDPSAELTFWILDSSSIGGGIVRFQGFSEVPIFFQGVEYPPYPIEGEGFNRTSDQQPRPKIRVGNVSGFITQLCLVYEDMVGAKLTRKRTFKKFIDSINFPPGEHLTEDPAQEYPLDIWYIERKVSENAQIVEFELASPLDFQNVKLPRRQIQANQCPAHVVYRGAYCGYVGPPVADIYNNPTTNPALDRCSKSLTGCKMRQWPDGVLNFGGVPAAGLVRT